MEKSRLEIDKVDKEEFGMIKAIQVHYDANMEQLFQYVSKAGFRWVAISLGLESGCKELQKNDWEKIAPYITELMNKYGLQCIQTHLPTYSLLTSAEVIEETMEKTMKRAIQVSADLGAKWCVAHPRSAVNQDYRRSVSLKRNLQMFSKYAVWAEEAGIGLAIENMPIFPGIHWKHFYGSDYEDLCELVDELNASNHKNVSICWDFGHAHLTKFNHENALRYVGNRISCTHIHNNRQQNDDHLSPSDGNMDWKLIMSALKEIGYEGPLTAEVNYGYEKNSSLTPDYGMNGMLESFVAHNYGCLKYLEKLVQ